MAYFFNAADEDDLALLHSTVRRHAERDTTVEEAERDVLGEFTVRTGTNTYEVALEGYVDADPATSHATLKAALKRAIAKVVSYRLRGYDRNPGYQRERLDVYEYDRGSGSTRSSELWPTGWDRELRKFFSETQSWFHI